MGCCNCKSRRAKDHKSHKIKPGEIPLEWNKDAEKFPEQTQSTQYSAGERLMPSSEVAGSREPIPIHKIKSKEVHKHSAEGNKHKEKKHEEEKKKHDSKLSLRSTREYQHWKERVRDTYPEETQNTQNSENAESGKSAKSLSEKHQSEKGVKEHLGGKSPHNGDDSLKLISETGADSSVMSYKSSKSAAAV